MMCCDECCVADGLCERKPTVGKALLECRRRLRSPRPLVVAPFPEEILQN